MKVLKVGGSCLRSAADYAAIAGRARAEGARVVVVSALFGVTDALVDLAAGRGSLAELARRHRGLVAGLGQPIRGMAEAALDALVSELATRLQAKERPPWELDAILGLGERLSLVVATAHADTGDVPVRARVAEQAGVVTDDQTGRAELLPEADELARARLGADAPGLDLVAGYVGRTRDGRWTTLGRGGSDVTAAFLARALGGEAVLFKDAPGVLSADPRLLEEARALSRLDPAHALVLARAGLPVVAEGALELAIRGVPLIVRPWSGDTPGTLIAAGPGSGRALAWSGDGPGSAVVTLAGPELPAPAEVDAALTGLGVAPAVWSEGALRVLAAEAALPQVLRRLHHRWCT